MEVIGFLCSAVFAGILLNRNVAGRLSDIIFNRLHLAANEMNSFAQKSKNRIEVTFTVKQQWGLLLYFSFTTVPIILIVLARIYKIPFLFWFAIAILAFYTLVAIILSLERYIPDFHNRLVTYKGYTLRSPWHILFAALILSVTMIPLFLFFIVIPTLVLRFLAYFSSYVFKEENLQKVMIYIGVFVLFCGLIIKLIASFKMN